MKNLSGREKFFITITILLVVGYVLVFVVFRVWTEQVEELDQRINAQKTKLARELKMIDSGKNMDRQFAANWEKFRISKSPQQVMSSILSQVEEIAGELKLKILELKPNTPQKEADLRLFSVNLMVEGSFKDIVKFVYMLQKDPYFFDVKQFRFDRDASSSESEISTRLVLEKMFVLDDAPAPSVVSP